MAQKLPTEKQPLNGAEAGCALPLLVTPPLPSATGSTSAVVVQSGRALHALALVSSPQDLRPHSGVAGPLLQSHGCVLSAGQPQPAGPPCAWISQRLSA